MNIHFSKHLNRLTVKKNDRFNFLVQILIHILITRPII